EAINEPVTSEKRFLDVRFLNTLYPLFTYYAIFPEKAYRITNPTTDRKG
ncbi:hypothetical protein HMPREF9446_03985, partial [Bacteroides fluxus YIT 12057]